MFELDAPNGNFPYTASSDNYNLIILPKDFDPTTWQKTFRARGRGRSRSTRPTWA